MRDLELPRRAEPVERYLSQSEGSVDRVVEELRVSGREPVIVVVPQQQGGTRDQSGLIFVLFLGLVFVAIIAMSFVACHETPIVHDTRVNPSCVAIC